MYIKTYNKDLRKACVEAIFSEFENEGDASLVDGIQDVTLADFTSAEIEGIAYQLNRKVGNTR